MQSNATADLRDAVAAAPYAGFTPHAHESSDLDADESARFERDGWVGNYSLLSPTGVAEVAVLRERLIPKLTVPDQLSQSTSADAFERRPWFKSMHACVPEFYDIACHPAIVRRVVSVLGPDLIVWGVTITRSGPGSIHRWHADQEHIRWHGLSVYLGLENTDLDSTLKVLTGSQRMPERPQAYGVQDDAGALGAVRREVPEAEIVRVPLEPGQFFLFAGRLWHGSHNTGTRTRLAMILHYSRPDVRVQVPLNFDDPIHWHASRPPCVLVAGQDRHSINRLVGRPAELAA